MQTNTIRNEIKQLAQNMETLAHQVQAQLDAGGNILPLANELVRNASTFTFTLGEMYAFSSNKTHSAVKTKSTSVGGSRNYHNVRDSFGRFSHK
jgi:hypothetical protein